MIYLPLLGLEIMKILQSSLRLAVWPSVRIVGVRLHLIEFKGIRKSARKFSLIKEKLLTWLNNVKLPMLPEMDLKRILTPRDKEKNKLLKRSLQKLLVKSLNGNYSLCSLDQASVPVIHLVLASHRVLQ